jgi:diguanylate cyclase (GGDEF)-like protein/PAS domain S-box-containing protein
MVLVDARHPELPVVYANPAYETLSGYTADELGGNAWPLLEGDAGPDRERLKAAVGRGEAYEAELTDTRKDGTLWPCRVSVEPLFDAQGVLKFFLCLQRPAGEGSAAVVRPIHTAPRFGGSAAPGVAGSVPKVDLGGAADETGRQRKVTALDRLDPATGLLRLAHFEEMLERDLAMARRDGRQMSVLVFEIVDFDVYQRTFGAKAADSCQRMIGAQITRALRRAGDLCARFDETTVVASTVGQTAEDLKPIALQIADHVRRLGLHNPRGRGRYVSVRTAIVACPPGTVADAPTIVARGRLAFPDVGGDPRIIRMHTAEERS